MAGSTGNLNPVCRLFLSTALFMVLFGLGGCAKLDRAAKAEKAETALIGLSKERLLACAGVPHRQTATNEWEYFTYFASGGSVGGKGAVTRRYCEATFVLQNNKVVGVNYTGETGGLLYGDEQCGYIVANCVN